MKPVMKPIMKKIIHLHDVRDLSYAGRNIESLCGAYHDFHSLWVREYAARAARGQFTNDLCPRCVDLATMAELADTAL